MADEKKDSIDTKAAQNDVYSMFTNAGMVYDSETQDWAVTDDGEPARFEIKDLLVKTDLTRFGMGLL